MNQYNALRSCFTAQTYVVDSTRARRACLFYAVHGDTMIFRGLYLALIFTRKISTNRSVRKGELPYLSHLRYLFVHLTVNHSERL